ncbi:MAG: Beta-lactamase domain protein [Candidatus Roizmanbacteria bacterium GW2011_GWA2_34_18]|uniref:Beta-lactamase domain protein n=1 Tax=Candidatus Roizmanbacteria bacterium GW2011_GWA2_34_18 TaxID=1618477 RepID=A0A0G0E237_9BACT|nr:MAG: Beta-lactamase domain protein [Candidatus Roizmanbacteria bacterium GW2011_GWA2_34_18]
MNSYKLHFIPLGGIVGVTKNMYVYEIYNDDKLKDIVIVDCGIGFPQEKELGVDFVIPDISYLTDKKQYIRAILITHGHEDHTSALPLLYEDLGRPPVYASLLTSIFIENKFKDRHKKIQVNRVDFNKEYSFGDFRVSYLKMTHSIPDTTHILIQTPVGTVYHGSDFKLDLTPPYGPGPDFYKITKAGHEGILCLLSDCLGAEREGLTLSENIVGQTFEDEMRNTKGKFIMTTFSSNISRIRQCVDAAIKFNRKICFLGRSMRENTKLAASIGYLPIPESLFIKEEEVNRHPPGKICLIVAGSQGQYGSALSKLADRQNANIKIKFGDKIIFSSDPIPGNENVVYETIEQLVEEGADVVYSDIADQLHSSGHGNQEDLKFLVRFTNPKYFIPIGGTIRHQRQYENLVEQLDYNKKDVFSLNEGETVWFVKNKAYLGDKIETKNIYVDAYGIGDVGSVILRDRKTLATDGIVLVLLIVDNRGLLLGQPKIVSRGFVFEEEENKLYVEAIKIVKDVFKLNNGKVFEQGKIQYKVIQNLEEFFRKVTGRKPLIVAEVIQL